MDRPRLLCYITDRTALAANEPDRCRLLLQKISEAAQAGVDFIQLREKDLTTRELESLARNAVHLVAHLKTDHRPLTTALLINSRTDVALAVGADGVHLRSADISPNDVREIWTKAHAPGAQPLISVSCHTAEEVTNAAFALFGPVFGKAGSTPVGLDALRNACRASIPVLALGGVTLDNATECFAAGAAGIAAIRLFQENDIAEVVHRLRSL